MRGEKLETITRIRLPGEAGDRDQIQRWNRGDRGEPGSRLIQFSEHQI